MMLFRGWAKVVFVLGLLVSVGGCSKAVAPTPPPPVVQGTPGANVRYVIGGDSRDDEGHVLPWAFAEAKARGATAFFFLGDMELTPELDGHFQRELPLLGPVGFYPVLGNHEVKLFGEIPLGRDHAERKFKNHFLNNAQTPVHSSVDGRVVYSVTLAGGVHFVALDNVTQKGFGPEQLAWLDHDLTEAHATPDVHFIIVGMHKPLAHNGVTTHAMDDDGAQAIVDSDAALAMMVKNKVALIVASHLHGYTTFTTQGIPTYITGGLGAPLTVATGPIESFHHFLQVEVVGDALKVEAVRFPGRRSVETEKERE